MKSWLNILLIVLYVNAYAQNNLVPNPSFEAHSQCPDQTAQFDFVENWYSPTVGSPDYFNSCTNSLSVSPQSNVFGAQNPRTGYGYAGLSPYFKPFICREYIQCQLLQTLDSGAVYCISFYISLGENSKYATNNMSIILSNNNINNTTGHCDFDPPMFYTPTLIWDSIYSDTVNWVNLSGTYIANGTERYLTIGNFKTNSQTDTISINTTIQEHSYYYIDDVSIIDCSPPKAGPNKPLGYIIEKIIIPNVFTPNGDQLNETFTIDNLPPNSNISIYNRWGTQVYQSINYQNNWNGATNSAGVYYYILTLPDGIIKKGTVTLLK